LGGYNPFVLHGNVTATLRGTRELGGERSRVIGAARPVLKRGVITRWQDVFTKGAAMGVVELETRAIGVKRGAGRRFTVYTPYPEKEFPGSKALSAKLGLVRNRGTPVIAVHGPDGAQKTALVTLLSKRLRNAEIRAP